VAIAGGTSLEDIDAERRESPMSVITILIIIILVLLVLYLFRRVF
jgi:uncharacterized protein HemY